MNEFIDHNNSEILTSIVTLLVTAIFRYFEKKRLKKKNNE